MRPPCLSPRRFSGTASIICYILLSSIEIAPREGYIGEGVSGARERDINASPMPISLVTFLFGHKKVTKASVKTSRGSIPGRRFTYMGMGVGRSMAVSRST